VISRTFKTKTSSDIGKQFAELIHQIPIVKQIINAEPTRKHEGRSPCSTIPPTVVL
jgi:hypothetical protein